MSKQISQHAAAAKMIRAELKKNGIKASVRAKSYAGGSSITVDLNEDYLPATAQKIEEFCGKFEMGSFNGMEDIYEYNNKDNDLPQVKFVFVNRNYSDQIRAEARAYVEANYNTDDEWALRDEVSNVLSGRSWLQGKRGGDFWSNRKNRQQVSA